MPFRVLFLCRTVYLLSPFLSSTVISPVLCAHCLRRLSGPYPTARDLRSKKCPMMTSWKVCATTAAGGDETAQSRFCDGDALANYFHSKARSVVGAGANVRRVARQRLALFQCQTPRGSGWRASATKCGGSPRRVAGDRLS